MVGTYCADVVISDDDSTLDHIGHPELGTIQVEVDVGRLVSRKRSKKTYEYTTYDSVGLVHERSKKAGAHCIRCVLLFGLEAIVQ